MLSSSRNRVSKLDLAPILHGPASRRRALRILFVHRVPGEVEQCLRELKRAHCNVSANLVSTPERFIKHLDSKYYDVVLAKYPMRDWQGPPVVEVLRNRERHVPVIFLTETIRPDAVAELITEGAAELGDRDHVGHLPVAIRRALSENNLREERDQTEKKLRHSEAHYRALVGNLAYGMCRCSMRGQFLDVNQALVTMLGYASREELLAANHASEILCDPAKRAQLLGHSTGHDGAGSLEIEWKRKNGTTLKVRLSGREVGDDGEMGSYEIIVED